MGEHYDTLLVAWLFILLIGGWLLVNALVDLGARRFREWLVGRESHSRAHASGHVDATTAAVAGNDPGDSAPRLPIG